LAARHQEVVGQNPEQRFQLPRDLIGELLSWPIAST